MARFSTPLRPAAIASALALAALGWATLATPAIAEAKAKRGIDVSRFNGTIDWQRVGQTQVEFAYVQASRGDGRHCPVVPTRCGPDELYEQNYRGARSAGIRVGAYHRAFTRGRKMGRAKTHARREARLFIAEVGKVRRRDLRPALDIEAPFAAQKPRVLQAWIRTWLRRVQRGLGVRPIIYTNNSSWQATGDTRRFARAGYLLWVANWDVPRPLVPARNWAGRGWEIWQHSSTGRVRGISGNVDRNRLRGGFKRLRAR